MTQDTFVGKSINLDSHPSLSDDKALVYMLNGDTTGFQGSQHAHFVQNVASNELCFSPPDGYELLGSVKMNKDQFTLFFKTPVSSEIGIFDASKCAYFSKVNNPCLNLQRGVKGRYKVKSGCDLRRVYFIEEEGPLRFIDIDECLPVSNQNDCTDCEKDLQFDCEKFNLNRCVRFPNIKLSKTSGNIPNGVYQIAIALSEDGQRFTDYHIYPETISFFSHDQGVNRFGIEVEFLDCPEGSDQYELVLIAHRDDRGTLPERIGFFPTAQDKVYVTELDDQRYVPISLDVLFSKMPKYQGADHIAVSDNMLVLGGARQRQELNYQPRARQIASKWVVKRVPANEAKDHYSFMRFETYGFTINGVYCDGSRTREFHIPSDAEKKIKQIPGKWDLINSTVSNSDVYESGEPCGDEETVKYWEIYDTSEVTCHTPFVPTPRGTSMCERWLITLQEPVGGPYTYSFTGCDGSTQNLNGSNPTFEICTRDLVSLTVSPNVTVRFTSLINFCGDYEDTDPPTSECPGGDCGEVFMKGDFAFWQSALKYPDNPCVWGQRTDPEADYYDPFGLSCEFIRYHKFPDNCTTHVHDNLGCEDAEHVNVLGVEFSNIQPFLDLKGDEVKDIVGYEINVYDRRNNKSILHKGMIYNMWEESLPDCTTSYFANFPFNDLNENIYLSRTRARYQGPFNFGERDYTPFSAYARDRFQYISPDVSYERNDTGEFLRLFSEENGFIEGKFSPTEDFTPAVILSDLAYAAILAGAALSMLDFTLGLPPSITISMDKFLAFIRTGLAALNETLPDVNYAMNYMAKTGYEGYNCENLVPGNTRRKIEFAQYLLPTRMFAGGDKVNNFQRESGLFLRLGDELLDPFTPEKSRFFLQDFDCAASFGKCQDVEGQVPRTSSYYSGVMVKKKSQYGYPESNISRAISKVIPIVSTSTGPLFGGDVKITKHRYIRKFPFFTNLAFGLPADTPFETSPYTNVNFPRFWLDNTQTEDMFSVFSGQISNDERNLLRSGKLRRVGCDVESGNCNTNLFFRIDGKFFTHVIGEASYWCESEYVADFRERNEIPESDIDRTDEQKSLYRTVQLPELFLYASQFRHRGVSVPKLHFRRDFDCCKPPAVCQDNTVVYSTKHDPLSKGDAWLKFPPANLQQYDLKNGKMTGIVEMNEQQLLFFFEDAVLTSVPDATIQTDGGRLFLGTPDLFDRQVRKLTDDASGFGGCQDIDSVVVTRWGAYWWDRARSKFVHYGDGLRDKTGTIRSWALSHLPKTSKIIGGFDPFTNKLYFSGTGKGDWTISFDPEADGFPSFHSFVPRLFMASSSNMLTVKDNSIWAHNSNKDFQTYYGKLYPFHVAFILKEGIKPVILQDLEINAEFFKAVGYDCKDYAKDFFDKIVVATRDKSTGLRPVLLKDVNNLNHYNVQTRTDIVEATEVEDSSFRLNGFSVLQTSECFSNLDFMAMKFSDERKSPTSVTTVDQSPMRGKFFVVHLIADSTGRNKIILQNVFANTFTNIR